MEHSPNEEQVTAFRAARDRVLGGGGSAGGIGTLGERCLHAIIKEYLTQNPDEREVRVGSYVADILRDGEITEIQTRRLDRLREKLLYFLDTHRVTVVYPLARNKTLTWVDPVTGALSEERKSPKHAKCYDALYELFGIRDLLSHPRLRVLVLFFDMKEYRAQTGAGKEKKRHAPRVGRVPTELVGEAMFSSLDDYSALVPEGLSEPFTKEEYRRATGIHTSAVFRAVKTLCDLGVIEPTGEKAGRKLLFRRCHP